MQNTERYKTGSVLFSYRRIGGVYVSLMTKPYEIDKDAHFSVRQNGVSFHFCQKDFGSRQDAFMAARAWNNDWAHFERFGGVVMEKNTAGYTVRPVYINGGF